ncbi:alpha/beta hydrolase [Sphingosinicella rhizophila]|uniref:Alpha/beta hydrolase-fold protein n=1 Tax=Sphingosinicella rhizophila TaxID=3050082 RepID=A0ABU3Q4Z4_9SPHN|nr:alpha/beta hydrolase-fold protein [Sphingosinicella sp. GR2756]MDT9598488.1 alpha/beta hydrolase-fold protein [Sphingosinicella sp. GR2756]
MKMGSPMRKYLISSWMACTGMALLAAGAPAAAQPATGAADATAANPVVLPQTQEIAMRSKAGLDYRIFVYVPATPPPPSGFPIIYVVDGNAWFTPMAHMMRLMANKLSGISPAIVVGIGYPSDVPFNQLRRFYDFIPDMPLLEKVPPGYTPPKIGGGDQFLRFIREELEPDIERRFSVDKAKRTLFGHSLGCSFAFHVLFSDSGAFQNYVCASPSLHFNGDYILKESERFIKAAASKPVAATLLYAVAEYDEKLPPSIPPELAERMAAELKRASVVTSGRALNVRLQKVPGLKTTFLEIMGENHLSEVPVLINRMLPLVLAPDGKP